MPTLYDAFISYSRKDIVFQINIYGNQVSAYRVLRGCSFYSKVKYCRAATRIKSKELTKRDSWGFRVMSIARTF